MALQFIFGPSGSGKSYYIYNKIIQESMENPDRQYLVLVPEQFTMQTQKELVMLHPRKGIMNIDVLSFERLAFRVLEETGALSQELLEETGKSMVLRKVAQEKKRELKLLGSKMNKQGYVSQLKSMVSELRQYEIGAEDLDRLLENVKEKPELFYKLKDIQTLYKGFFDYLEGKFITQEEVLDVLAQRAEQSGKLRDSTVVLDGYTGFTPIQIQVLEKLLKLCRQVYIPLTMGRGEDPYRLGAPYGLFYLTRQTVHKLCTELEDAVELTDKKAEYISFKDNATDQAALEKAVEQLSASTLAELAMKRVATNIVYDKTRDDAKDMMEVYKDAVNATNGNLDLGTLSMSGLVNSESTNPDYSHDLCTAAMFAVNGTVPTAAAMKAIAENVKTEINEMVDKAISNGINFEYTYVVSVSAVTKTLQPAYNDASNSVTIFAVNVSRDATMVD